MATIFKRKGAGAWVIQYFDASGRRREKSSRTTDRRAADRIASKLEADVALRREGVIDADQARTAQENRKPLSQHIEEHLRHVERAERTKQTVKARRRALRWLQEETGATRISDFTAEAFEKARARLRAQGRSAMTANHRHQGILAFLNWCVKMGRVASNPLRSLNKLNADADRRYIRRPLTEEELWRLFRVAKDHDRLLWYAMSFYAGMRRGELGRLRWGDVDLEAAALTVRRGKAKRTDVVPLHADLVEILRQARPANFAFDAAVFPELVTNKTRIRDFERAKVKLVDDQGRHADLHSMRMTLHTMLAKGGVPAQVAQRLLRHADYRTTLKHYFHIETAEAGGALRALPRVQRADAVGVEPQQNQQQSMRESERRGATSRTNEGASDGPGRKQNYRRDRELRDEVRDTATECDDDDDLLVAAGNGLGNRRSIQLSYGRFEEVHAVAVRSHVDRAFVAGDCGLQASESPGRTSDRPHRALSSFHPIEPTKNAFCASRVVLDLPVSRRSRVRIAHRLAARVRRVEARLENILHNTPSSIEPRVRPQHRRDLDRCAQFSVQITLCIVIAGLMLSIVALPRAKTRRVDVIDRETARELVAGLEELRSAINEYRLDHGCAPGFEAESDENASCRQATAAWFERQLTRRSDAAGDTNFAKRDLHPFGPYLAHGIPINPIHGLSTVRLLDADEPWPESPDGTTGWLYRPSTGEIRPNGRERVVGGGRLGEF